MDASKNPSGFSEAVNLFTQAVKEAEKTGSIMANKKLILESLKQLGALVGSLAIAVGGLSQENDEFRARIAALENPPEDSQPFENPYFIVPRT